MINNYFLIHSCSFQRQSSQPLVQMSTSARTGPGWSQEQELHTGFLCAWPPPTTCPIPPRCVKMCINKRLEAERGKTGAQHPGLECGHHNLCQPLQWTGTPTHYFEMRERHPFLVQVLDCWELNFANSDSDLPTYEKATLLFRQCLCFCGVPWTHEGPPPVTCIMSFFSEFSAWFKSPFFIMDAICDWRTTHLWLPSGFDRLNRGCKWFIVILLFTFKLKSSFADIIGCLVLPATWSGAKYLNFLGSMLFITKDICIREVLLELKARGKPSEFSRSRLTISLPCMLGSPSLPLKKLQLEHLR